MSQLSDNHIPKGRNHTPPDDFQLLYFSELIKKPICAEKIKNRIGNVTDLVFRLAEPYPIAMGIYIEHGWGKPTEFIPWKNVIKIDTDAIFVSKPEGGEDRYFPFVDQPGWILVNDHLMGRTILDMDGRKTEVVNDLHLLESRGRMLIVHVDVSINGFLRKWRLGKFIWAKDRLISWRYVQPLSLEDVGAKDTVTLSVTRKQAKELPSEDLADALEELSGEEQQAFFSVLDAEKAAETLIAAEPRTQRQLVADLRREKASIILSQLSVPQLADLFSVLPHDDMVKMMKLLPKETADRINAIISEHETTARTLISQEYLAINKDITVGEVLKKIRTSGLDNDAISYVYFISEDKNILQGVIDLRDIVLASDDVKISDLMVAPVVAAQEDDIRETLEEMFAKYHFRMIPVVDEKDILLGVVRYNDIMTGLTIRVRR